MVAVTNESLEKKYESDARLSANNNNTSNSSKCRDLACFALFLAALLSSNFFSVQHFHGFDRSTTETEALTAVRNGINPSQQNTVLDTATEDASSEELKPYCLKAPFYGGTSNNVIEVGKLLRILNDEGKHRKLGLDKHWTQWYKSHFDERPDVLFDYYPDGGDCEQAYIAQDAFFLGDNDWDLSYIRHLTPSSEHRDTAEAIIKSWPHGRNYISVHRRDLEGTCHISARCPLNRKERKGTGRKCVEQRDPNEACSVELRLQACDMEYSMVDNPKNLPVILFTDRQVPDKDSTFPQIFNETAPMFVEMWLMAQSQTHWGNPRSSVDAVVSSWRNGMGLEPKPCYGPDKILFQM
ncbi:unnamed protein product [Cylindrotheca closterium]|uniref:Uncharacterized protein n=1 Tax=Cylindrotheca closterium TaxID=2856 RepID=A0AAD2G8C8_9STRA|nr:unnamed protein product [Cylindrotheca closterium]